MKIIQFEVESMKSYDLTYHLKFEAGSIIVKADNGKVYFNERTVTVIIEKENAAIRNVSAHINFMSFEGDEIFTAKLDDLDQDLHLTEFCNLYISNVSDVTDFEFEELQKEIQQFSINNLIDYALDTGNKKLFMELTNNVK